MVKYKIFDSPESKVSCGISILLFLIAIVIAAPDERIGVPIRTGISMFILIFGVFWFGMTMGVEIEKQNRPQTEVIEC
jgi:uncharacterized membrane protein